ncbi:MAG: CPBP family intramembrane metalloprotease [Firmicutes bacterium]|nr:CPBP family intramembrane metalloprotease [Bacillota bacterium]
MYIIYGITLAPIVEELIFRGVILNRLKIRFGIILAIFVSAILFGIAHFDINIIGRLIFGLLCAILFFQTRNILNCIILHLLNNASIFMFPVLSKYTNFSINTNSEFEKTILMIIIFSCFVSSIVFSIIYIKNNLATKKHII